MLHNRKVLVAYLKNEPRRKDGEGAPCSLRKQSQRACVGRIEGTLAMTLSLPIPVYLSYGEDTLGYLSPLPLNIYVLK